MLDVSDDAEALLAQDHRVLASCSSAAAEGKVLLGRHRRVQQAGVCAGSNRVTCAPLDACHDVRVCVPATGVCTNPAKVDGSSCDDNDACSRTDACQAGTCSGGNPVICTALDDCHDVGTCDAGTGVCGNPAKADGTSCPGGNCQAGVCVSDATVSSGSGMGSTGTGGQWEHRHVGQWWLEPERWLHHRPIADNETDEWRQKSRRVQFVVKKKKGGPPVVAK